MDIHHIEYFLTLKQYEHVAIAADFLNISRPALSKSIATLENELGVKLFDRVGRRIKLNQNGENFARYAEQALQLLQMGSLSAKSMCYEMTGSIKIVCYAYAPIILACVNAYSELNPHIAFSIIQWQSGESVDGNDMPDFILRSLTDPDFQLKKDQYWVPQKLFQERYYLIASPDYGHIDWEEYGKNLDFSLLKDAFFITMLQDDLFFNDIVYELSRRAGFIPKIYGRTDDFVVKIKMVEQGRGLAIIPESCLKDAQKLSPGLKSFLCSGVGSERSVFLFHPHEGMMTEAASDFYDFVLDFYQHPEERVTDVEDDWEILENNTHL